jgi:hypothetical protein
MYHFLSFVGKVFRHGKAMKMGAKGVHLSPKKHTPPLYKNKCYQYVNFNLGNPLFGTKKGK